MFTNKLGGFILFLSLSCLLVAGCDNEKVQGLVDKGKELASDGLETVKEEGGNVVQDVTETVTDTVNTATDGAKETLNLAGNATVTVDAEVKTNACYAQLITFTSGRSNVLQMQTYKDAETETFPSMFLRAEVEASTVEELNGKEVTAKVFVQPEANGPLWSSPAPVTVSLVVAEKKLIATLTGGKMRNSQNADELDVKGMFTSVLP